MSNWLVDRIYSITGISINLDDISHDENAQLLITASLAAAAEVDGEHSPDESRAIIRILQQEFAHSPADAIEMLSAAVQRVREEGQVDQLFNEINNSFQLPHREKLFSLTLELVAADGAKSSEELHFVNQLAQRLELPEPIVSRSIENAFHRPPDIQSQ